MNKNLLIFFCLLFPFISQQTLYAQQRIVKGIVYDEYNKPIDNASIFLLNSIGQISAYTFSNSKGAYTFSISDTTNIASIKVSHIAYETLDIHFQKGVFQYNCHLKYTNKKLPEVIVKDVPFITQRGDTINYRVNKFASQGDITIGDVLKKIPGITINKNGAIAYNGTTINRFYIDGNDLLGNKYNIAETTVPQDIVDQIQVYENHQPIKILEGIENTNRPALNLKLNDKAKARIIGTAEAKTGMPNAPTNNSDANINGMLFRHKLQFLNKIAYDATGRDLLFDIKSHSLEDWLETEEHDLPPIINIKGIMDPDIEQSRWHFNKTGLITTNTLIKLPNKHSLKINAYFSPESTQLSYEGNQQIILSKDSSVTQKENQALHTKGNQFFGQINYLANNKKYYLQNNLKVEIDSKANNSGLTYENGSMTQKLQNHFVDIENKLQYLRTFKGKILKVNEELGYLSAPQNLRIMPDIGLSVDTVYDFTIQNLQQKSFFNNAHIGMDLSKNKFLLNATMGLKYQHNEYHSSLYLMNDDTTSELGSQYQNDAKWNLMQSYIQGGISYKSDGINISVSLPLYQNEFRFFEQGNQQKTVLNSFSFNPLLNVVVAINALNSFSFNFAKDKSFGRPQSLLPGYILQNYRTLITNNAPLKETKSQNISFGYTYKKIIEGFSSGMLFSAFYNQMNTISNSTYQPSGLTIIDQMAYANKLRNYLLTLFTGKYFFKAETSVKLSANMLINKRPIFQNNILNNVSSNTKSIALNISTQHFKKVECNNEVNISLDNAEINKQQEDKSSLLLVEDNFKIKFYLNKTLQLSYNADFQHMHSEESNNNLLISDVECTYLFTKSKNRIAIGAMNLFNQTNYRYNQISSTSIYQSSYALRPRSFYIQYSFRF